MVCLIAFSSKNVPWTKIHFPRWDFFSECIIQKRRLYAFEWCIQKKNPISGSVLLSMVYLKKKLHILWTKIHFPRWDFFSECIIRKRRVYAFEWCIQKKNPISGSVFSSMVHFFIFKKCTMDENTLPEMGFFFECIIRKRRLYAFD